MFWYGLCAGFAINIPPGPLGVLCITRTVRYGLLAGIIVGLVVAGVDGLVYGTIASLGVEAVGGMPPWIRRVASILAAVALLVMGLRALRRARRPLAQDPQPMGHFRAVGGALLLALATPVTLPALLVLFATFGITDMFTGAAGVFIGAMLWWSALCAVAYFQSARALRNLPVLDYTCCGLLWLGASLAARFAILD